MITATRIGRRVMTDRKGKFSMKSYLCGVSRTLAEELTHRVVNDGD